MSSVSKHVIASLGPACVLCAAGTTLQLNDSLRIQLFGRSDVLWISILFAWVLGIRLATGFASRRWGGAVLMVSAAVSWLVGQQLFHLASPSTDSSAVPWVSQFGLSAFSLSCLATLGVGTVLALCGRLFDRARPDQESSGPVMQVFTAVIVALVPFAYADSVARAVQDQLVDAIQDDRPVKALGLATTLTALASDAEVFGQRPGELIEPLQRRVSDLNTIVSSSPVDQTDLAAVGRRAMALIQLDRNQDAIALLTPLTFAPDTAPVAFDYCGLCCQRLQRWDASLQWYEESRDFWMAKPRSSQRTHALLSAYKGIAFANRKLDNSLAAEQAYKQALLTSPTAEIHYLMALHYEDQQQTSLATDHVKQSMLLAPDRYQQPGEELLSKMSRSHFGCLSVR
jgi:hypothetical protein